MISVIIPVSNNQTFLDQTLTSLERQIFKDFEVIIILNGTNNLKVNYLDYDIKINLYKINDKGAAIARNFGIQKSNYDIICFLDSDDTWEKNKLYLQLKHFKSNNLNFSYTNYSFINKNLSRNCYQIKSIMDLATNNPICTSSVMIRKKLFEKRGFENFKMRSDFEFYLYLYKNSIKPIFFDEKDHVSLVNYRVHSLNLTYNKIEATFFHFKILLKYFGYFKSVLLELKYLINHLGPNFISKKYSSTRKHY